MKNLGRYKAQLLPCPFCGEAAYMNENLIDIEDSPYYMARIECTGCDLEMDGSYEEPPKLRTEMEWEGFETRIKHDLACRWNTRATPGR